MMTRGLTTRLDKPSKTFDASRDRYKLKPREPGRPLEVCDETGG
jgi:hypothetical protein